MNLHPDRFFHHADVKSGYVMDINWAIWVVALNDKNRFEFAAEFNEDDNSVWCIFGIRAVTGHTGPQPDVESLLFIC